MQPIRIGRLARRTLLIILAVGSLHAAADETYRWTPLFQPGLEPTYKDCEFLQSQLAERERSRSEAHQKCLDAVLMEGAP